jgi:hypothetical protein
VLASPSLALPVREQRTKTGAITNTSPPGRYRMGVDDDQRQKTAKAPAAVRLLTRFADRVWDSLGLAPRMVACGPRARYPVIETVAGPEQSRRLFFLSKVVMSDEFWDRGHRRGCAITLLTPARGSRSSNSSKSFVAGRELGCIISGLWWVASS